MTGLGSRLEWMDHSVSPRMQMRQVKVGPVQVEDYVVTTVFRSPGSEGTLFMEDN